MRFVFLKINLIISINICIYIFFFIFLFTLFYSCAFGMLFASLPVLHFRLGFSHFDHYFVVFHFSQGLKNGKKKLPKKKQQENSDTHTRAKSHPHIRTHTHARTRTHTHTLKNAHAAEKKYEQFFFIFLVIFCIQISWCVKFIIYVYFKSGFRFLLHYSWDFVQDGACKTLRKIYDFLSEELALFSVSIVCD